MYKIEKLDDFGRGITHVNDKICFVENALEGEEVELDIIKETSKYIVADVVRYVSKSKDRIKVDCPYYDKCGGCNLRHLKYKDENKYKIDKVNNIINRFSDLNISIDKINYKDEYNYRNKVILHGNDKALGFYSKNSHDIVDVESCLICSNMINQIIDKIRNIGIIGIKEVLIRVSNDDKKSIVHIRGSIDIDKYKDICNVFIYNNKVISNKKSIISNIGNKKYYLSGDSFFQVNRFLVSDLYDEVKENIKGKKVLDLYCGTGSIGIYVCSDNIIGIDNNISNIYDANRNLELNDMSGEFYLADVEDIIDRFNDFDTVIVDPPRSGLDKITIENLKRINSKRIIYVSCEPITLVRDLNLLKDNYDVKSINLYNLFPRTYHVECISVLEQRNVEK